MPDLPSATVDGQPWSPPSRYALLGTFDLAGMRAVERWRRLIDGEFGGAVDVIVAVVRPFWSRSEAAALTASTSPSRHASTLAVKDPAGSWERLTHCSEEKPAFAAAIEDGHVTVLVNTSTEEAWETLRDGIQRLTTGC